MVLSFFAYDSLYPEEDEYVIGIVSSINEGFSVDLLLPQYNSCKAFLPVNEITRKRMTQISHFLTPERMYLFKIIQIQEKEENVYIDCSRKIVTEQEEKKYFHLFGQQKAIHTLFLSLPSIEEEEFYEQYVYPYRQKILDIDQVNDDPAYLFLLSLKEKEDFSFRKMIENKLKLPLWNGEKILSKVYVDITCFGKEGIDGIRMAIYDLISYGYDVYYKSSPTYTVQRKDEKEIKREDFSKLCEEIEEKLKDLEVKLKLF